MIKNFLWNSKPAVWLRKNVAGGLIVTAIVSLISLACLAVVGIV